MEVCCLGKFRIHYPDKELKGGCKEKKRLEQDDRGGNGPKMCQSVLEGEGEKEERTNCSRPLNDISNTKVITYNKIGRLPLASS
jgi:phage/plasmid primase-like uncharacterized protein